MKFVKPLGCLILILLSSCGGGKQFSIASVQDDVYIFDAKKKIYIADYKLSDYPAIIKNELNRQGYITTTNTNADYMIKLHRKLKKIQVTEYETISSTYSGTGTGAANGVDATYTYTGDSQTRVPVNRIKNLQILTLLLYDKTLSYKPTLIWKGTIVGDYYEVNLHNQNGIQQLISHLGKNLKTTSINLVRNKDYKRQEQPLPIATKSLEPLSVHKPSGNSTIEHHNYFPEGSVVINQLMELNPDTENRYIYIKTRRLQTKQFDGYILFEADGQYQGLLSWPDEHSLLGIGLGAIMTLEDGIYTWNKIYFKESTKIKHLSKDQLVKALSLPLEVGNETIVPIFKGEYLTNRVERKENIKTHSKTFNDCYVVSSFLTRYGHASDKTEYWLCENAGIVQIRGAVGKEFSLTNSFIVR